MELIFSTLFLIVTTWTVSGVKITLQEPNLSFEPLTSMNSRELIGVNRNYCGDAVGKLVDMSITDCRRAPCDLCIGKTYTFKLLIQIAKPREKIWIFAFLEYPNGTLDNVVDFSINAPIPAGTNLPLALDWEFTEDDIINVGTDINCVLNIYDGYTYEREICVSGKGNVFLRDECPTPF